VEGEEEEGLGRRGRTEGSGGRFLRTIMIIIMMFFFLGDGKAAFHVLARGGRRPEAAERGRGAGARGRRSGARGRRRGGRQSGGGKAGREGDGAVT
jgi:hypothetical protein